MHIVNAAQMRELDRATIETIGIPGIVLMENAGRGTAEYILRTFPESALRRVVVLCGCGNNGGDGFVIARCLMAAGARVCAILLTDSNVFKAMPASTSMLFALAAEPYVKFIPKMTSNRYHPNLPMPLCLSTHCLEPDLQKK